MNLDFGFMQRSGSGSMEATLQSGNIYTIDSISGTYNGETITGLVSSWRLFSSTGPLYTMDNRFDSQGSNSFRPVGGNDRNGGYAFTTNAGTVVRSYFYLGNLSAEQLVNSGTFNTSQGFTQTFTAQIPAPLPILGLPAMFFYSRKIKKRLKQRSLAPVSD